MWWEADFSQEQPDKPDVGLRVEAVLGEPLGQQGFGDEPAAGLLEEGGVGCGGGGAGGEV